MTIDITLVPTFVHVRGVNKPKQRYAFLHREDQTPELIMKDVHVKECSEVGQSNTYWFYGEPVGDFNFTHLRDGDRIVYMTTDSRDPVITESVFVSENTMAFFEPGDSLSSLACGLKSKPGLVVSLTQPVNDTIQKATRVAQKMQRLYTSSPMYANIMMKENGEIKSYDLLSLIDKQEPELRQELEMYLLSIDENRASSQQSETILQKILSKIQFDEHFSLLTEEEQVGHFIEFSRLSSDSKLEYVPDTMIEQIKNSHEYTTSLETMSEAGLGHSQTQQFNVLQQIGYFSKSRHNENILYNLSDMGAGKTLMTVQAINVLDKKQLSTWLDSDDFDRYPDVSFSVPDKHIITPTLSVLSSWIDTFKIFYDVERITDSRYRLTMNYRGYNVQSYVHVAPFTIKNSLVYVGEKLPQAENNTYLIIDEVHQLVKKAMPRTKFFPPKTEPVSIYKTFILSGTMSNLLTHEWLNFIRLMGLPITSYTNQEANRVADAIHSDIAQSVSDGLAEIHSVHRRTVDKGVFNEDNIATIDKRKLTAQERYFFSKYGTLIASPPNLIGDVTEKTYAEYLDDLGRGHVRLEINPDEADTTNFELFYNLVGPRSVTAESATVAEELFGSTQKQHVSDIIKTASPLNNNDIQILKTLHHIAEDYHQYKSLRIAKSINTAILNLNDGLQTENIYDILTKAAEKNTRFFEYLSTLDLNVLEQLPQSNLIRMPTLEETEKFRILQDILKREEDETHLIVVNDFHAMKTLSDALGITSVTRKQLRDELSYQDTLDGLFEKQSIVVVTQDMIKSSLDLVQANRLVQYQLNTEISDIIQTQNRINRIGQTRETRGYYIASDALQENLIELFLDSYQNIRVAHKGIVELFVDVTSQINIVNNYLAKAFSTLEQEDHQGIIEEPETTDVVNLRTLDDGVEIAQQDGITQAILMPNETYVSVLVPLNDASHSAFELGELNPLLVDTLAINSPTIVEINLNTLEVYVNEEQANAV